MDVLIINGHDYSRYIERRGLSWTRNDVDSDQAGRTLDAVMHRAKIAEKRTCSYKLVNMPQALLAQLDTDLGSPIFSATYLDLHGVQTRQFYCSSFSATLSDVYDADSVWDGAAFTMIER